LATRAQLHEIEFARLQRKLETVEKGLVELEHAMSSSLIGGLPIFSSGMRRIGDLKRSAAAISKNRNLELGNFVEMRARERMCEDLSTGLKQTEARARIESDLLELLSHSGSARLPQVKGD
jgi:hypothetical protein